MSLRRISPVCVLLLLLSNLVHAQMQKVGPPPVGKIYHGVYPGGVTGEEDDITPADVAAYVNVVGRPVAWVYFSNNWYTSRSFPVETATWIRQSGAAPYVRLMIRSIPWGARNRWPFRLADILRGDLDADLRLWAQGARDFGTPLVVEYGTECNGKWFPWNARRNGGGRTRGFGDPAKPDGTERFVAVFRHIVTVMREEGATNITWVFHVNWDDWPQRTWNRLEDYYPGDDVVDWVAISAYGPQMPRDNYLDMFRDAVDSAYPRVRSVAPGKPVVIAEFGATAGNPLISAENWAATALDDLIGDRWPAVIAFSWWNERWQNDNNPAHDTTMRVQDIPALGDVFRTKLAAGISRLQLTPVFF